MPTRSFGSPALSSLVTLLLAAGPVLAQDADTGPRDPAYRSSTTAPVKPRTPGRPQGDDPLGHVEWMRQRMGGDLTSAFMHQLLSEAERERAKYPERFGQGRALPAAFQAGVNAWVNLGPTSSDFNQSGRFIDSGRARVILPDPSDPTGNTLYYLNAGGGLWKTTNFLAAAPTWVPLTDQTGSTAGGSVAFGRAPGTLYLGVGDPFDANVGGFMIVSTDGGSTWSNHVPLGNATSVRDVQVDRTGSADVVLVATNAGLFRSTDGGKSFQTASSPLDAGSVWSLARSNAGWMAFAKEPGSSTGAVYFSKDQGLSWTPVAAGISNSYRATFALAQPGDSVAYAIASNASGSKQLDLFKSTDGGQSWTALGITGKTPVNPNADQRNLDVLHNQAWYNQMILVDPSDPARNTVYLGGNLSSVMTSDGGSSWTVISSWAPDSYSGTQNLPYVHADFHCAAASDFGGVHRLYFGTDGGIFTSTDAKASGAAGHWESAKNVGLSTHLIYALAATPSVPGSALTGLQDNGTRLRVGLSSTFNEVQGGDGFGVGWSQANGQTTLGSYVYNSISICTADPADPRNWRDFTQGLDPKTKFYFVTPIASPAASADATGTVFFTYGGDATYRSDAQGWTKIATVGARSVSHGLGVSPLDLGRIALADEPGIRLSADGGLTWTLSDPAIQVPTWGGLAANVAFASNTLLYACSEATGSGAVRVVRSMDGGRTWANPGNKGLPDIPVSKLVPDPNDGSGNSVLAATWLGVYQSTDGGANWSLLGRGLPQVRVSDLYLAPDGAFIRASTWGRGVWEIANAPVAGSVTIAPANINLRKGAPQQFSASVAGGGAVTWSSTGSGGAVSAQGLFTATAAGDYTVTAQAGAQSATARIYVPPVGVKIAPAGRDLLAGEAFTFGAAVTGTVNTGVTWTASAGAFQGASSVYTAPAAPGAVTITATSVDDPSKKDTLALQVSATTGLAANPGFESGLSPWTNLHDGVAMSMLFDNASAAQLKVPERSHSGAQFIWLNGNYGDKVAHLDELSQSFVLPAAAKGVSLNLWINVDSSDSSGVANDTLTINLVDGAGTAHTLDTLSNLDASGDPTAPGYLLKSYDLSAYKGQRVKVQLLGQETKAQATSFLIDDVSVTAYAGPGIPRPTDLNGDGVTGLADLLVLGRDWGSSNPVSDLNGDGLVDDQDLALLLAVIAK